MTESKQKNFFSISVGNQWYNRNFASSVVHEDEKMVQILQFIELSPKKVLEIGCSNHRFSRD